jgi:hypothetical protein
MVCAERVRLRAIALAACVWLAACTVGIEDKSGGDPCANNPCQSLGVCKGLTATCTNVKGKAQCSSFKKAGKTATAASIGYQASETACDGKDNDCDGVTDEGAVPTTACNAKGICAGSTAKPVAACVLGAVACDWSAVPGWEATETTCDGQDNDCDGQTDETTRANLKDCRRMGVCQGLPEPVCKDGAWNCGYSAKTAEAAAVPLDYEVTETLCDGKDNDCDGLVDAGLAGAALGGDKPVCPDKGVCAGAVTIACKGGAPACDFGAVAGWEPYEITCDGKDNDCDGKTDNFQGSAQALVKADATGCKTGGVCGAHKSAIVQVCQGGSFQCSYAAIPAYEATETSCDGLDNDCDGTPDAPLDKKPIKSPCGLQGVCGAPNAQKAVVCDGGSWTCSYAALIALAYEPFEQTCDGKDNDCDGKVDETAGPAQNGCLATGVCTYGTVVQCSSGKATCDYGNVLGYEVTTETTCDGKDNDCDGKTDEPDGLDLKKSPCGQGVCAGKAVGTCVAGKWSCTYAGVIGHEDVEASCDGKDNDCDGQTDEGLNDPAAAKCPTAGVCSAGVTAVCSAGQYLCQFGAVAGYEASEKSCDGKDNDCDGKVDTGLCGAGSACTENGPCQSASCSAVLGATTKACAAQAGGCVADGSAVADGSKACVFGTQQATCSNGVWSAPKDCPKATPSCVAGECVVCAPNATTCDPVDKTKVVKCAADGKSSLPLKTCDTGTHCSGAGQCVPDGAITLSDKAKATNPVAVALPDGQFAVAWVTDATVFVRLFGADGKALGASAQANTGTVVNGTRVAGAKTKTGFALAWTQNTATSGDTGVAVRLFDFQGAPVGPATVPSAGISGKQEAPVLTWNGSALYLAWSGENIDQDGLGIGLYKLDATGKAIGDFPAVVTADPANAQDQRNPALAVLTDGSIAVVWLHSPLFGTAKLSARIVQADGVKFATGVVDVSTGTPKGGSFPALVLQKGELLLAWAANGVDGAGLGVSLRRLDLALKPLGDVVVANTTTMGDQDEPWLELLPNGLAVLVWRSADHIGKGTEIVARDFKAGGVPAGAEFIVTNDFAAGDQDQPRVLVLSDGRAAYVYRDAANEIRAIFR